MCFKRIKNEDKKAVLQVFLIKKISESYWK